MSVLRSSLKKIKLISNYEDQVVHKKESNIYEVSFRVQFGVMAFLSFMFYVIMKFDQSLPTPKLLVDEFSDPGAFIAERAAIDLKYLTDLGPKIVGSYENEYIVVQFLTNRIKDIIKEAHESQLIELDVQIAKGGYILNNSGHGYFNAYNGIQNVIVKLHGKYINLRQSVLVNSHYDSVPSSPGGTDDGINVVAMLEILRKLSKMNTKLNNNVIFLFNGAEESALQASHAFVTQHKWAKECINMINLEGHGGGGKAILFQTGPDTPWLINHYQNVPHPFGNVIAEEIFQSGYFPSDTDFRIFRDFGHMRGFDISFYTDSYRYHTSFDGYGNIPLGSFQHVGDNVLYLVKSLANEAKNLNNDVVHGKSVYFDVYGFFMITYSESTAYFVNVAVALFSIGVFVFSISRFKLGLTISSVKYFSMVPCLIVGSWLLAGLFLYILAVGLDQFNRTLSWYANPWMIFGLYVIPIIGFSGSLMTFSNYKSFSLNVRSQLQAHILRLICTAILLVGTFCKIRSVFLFNIPIVFNGFGLLVIHLLQLQCTIRRWQVVYSISIFFPIMFLMNEMLKFLILFIPILGRMGADVNPEFYIGFFMLLLLFLIISPLTILTNSVRQPKIYFLILAAIFSGFLILLVKPTFFPYNEDKNSPKLQRHYVMHTHRQFFNQFGELLKSDSGFSMSNMDRNSPTILKDYVKELSDAAYLSEMCSKYPLCALPLSQPKTSEKIEHISSWIPSNSFPQFPKNETLNVTITSNKLEIDNFIRINYTVAISGPDKLAFYLTPRINAILKNISLFNGVLPTKVTFMGRPVYMMIYQLGKHEKGSLLSFNITMEKPKNQTGPTLDIAVIGRYVHEKLISRTPDFTRFLNQFPKWTHVISWLAAYHSYVI